MQSTTFEETTKLAEESYTTSFSNVYQWVSLSHCIDKLIEQEFENIKQCINKKSLINRLQTMRHMYGTLEYMSSTILEGLDNIITYLKTLNDNVYFTQFLVIYEIIFNLCCLECKTKAIKWFDKNDSQKVYNYMFNVKDHAFDSSDLLNAKFIGKRDVSKDYKRTEYYVKSVVDTVERYLKITRQINTNKINIWDSIADSEQWFGYKVPRGIFMEKGSKFMKSIIDPQVIPTYIKEQFNEEKFIEINLEDLKLKRRQMNFLQDRDDFTLL